MIPSALLLALLLLPPSPADVTVVQFPSKGKTTLSLGGKNKVDVQRVGTVTRADIQMEGLQPAQSARAGMNSYVVWAVSPEGTFDNLGELAVSGTKGSLEATTRFDRFAILVTLEPHYMVDRPNSRVVYKNERSRDFPGVPLTIEVGAYDYPDLPSTTAGVLVPTLVMEARAAMAIATAAQADRQAEREFRDAKASIETMEELLRRASPADVVDAAAHAAIRLAQRAATQARR